MSTPYGLITIALNLLFGSVAALYAEPSVPSGDQLGLAPPTPQQAHPLRALLIAGGCCHDYENQTRILSQGIQARANVRVDVVWTREEGHDPFFPLFKDPNWAQGYDLVIHDECAALKKDEGELQNILNAHKTVPAVHLHCAIHSFRGSENNWHEHIGISSDRHGPHVPVSVKLVNKKHPITATLKDWVTDREELYNNVDNYGVDALAMGSQTYKKGGKDVTDTAIVAWTNTKFGAPSFSTSLGHFNHTCEDPRYLELVVRGALWACGKLDDKAYFTPYTGSNQFHEITERRSVKPKASSAVSVNVPKGALLATASAQSVQTGEGHHPWKALDGDPKTRWCGAGPQMPTWFQLALDKPVDVSGAEIDWEIAGQWMQYRIETSIDGKSWGQAFDASRNRQAGQRRDAFAAKGIRFVRVTALKQQNDMWPSLFELRLYGANGKQLLIHPRGMKRVVKTSSNAAEKSFAKGGNAEPRPHRLSAEDEAELMKDVETPKGFRATLFAPSEMANYPAAIAAAPNGDLYVSSDGNASGGQQPGRGRVVRLRDTDGDGRADQVTEFVRDVDTPRGLIWDHDRLYLLHPPHITVYHDPDGDGVADASERLISNIGFGFKDKRGGDHTTNGLAMGIDGWIYVAVGDFGIMKATGTDGRSIAMRDGGVVRFRPDGSGLEIFSRGTRNIYGLAVSPTLDLFTRDNTNDGAGWNVRFHHFTGFDNHGYPRLYKNFSDEARKPLADYGGGSGCGAFYLDEPGIPAAWNNRPYTCDWGRQGSYRHVVTPDGASFKETEKPAHFFKMTRPTDGDVDGMSAVYQASWKGPANFFWKGVNQGYVARMTPIGYKAPPVPDFATRSDAELVAILRTSQSHVRRLNAQRMLLRRPLTVATKAALLAVAGDRSLGLAHRVAALYAISQRGLFSGNADATFKALDTISAEDPLMAFVVRASGDFGLDLRTAGKAGPVAETWWRQRLRSKNPREALEAIIATTRQGKLGLASDIGNHLGSKDPVIVHVAYHALIRLNAWQATLPFLASDDPNMRKSASWALMRMHEPALVAALLSRMNMQQDGAKRRDLIAVLARLYHKEGEWKGDSWATRPDSRGPYYQLATWGESSSILAGLNAALEDTNLSTADASYLVATIGKNRIQNDHGLARILSLASQDASLLATAVGQLAEKGSLPDKAVPLVLRAARSDKTPPPALQQCVTLLLEANHPDAFAAIMDALHQLQVNQEASNVRDVTRKALLASAKLENHTAAFAALFLKEENGPKALWAGYALLQLANGQGISKEAQAKARAALDEGWAKKKTKITLMDAAFWTQIPVLNDRISAAMNDADAAIVRYAKRAGQRLRIQPPGVDKTPKVASLSPAESIAKVVAYKGGSIALGEAIFKRATCVACHTVHESEPQKGPFLGSIANIYRRQDLAEAIVLPNKTMAQGFTTNVFLLKNGHSHVGFVTKEAEGTVTLRDVSSAERTIQKADVATRTTLPTSMMPPALMNSFSVHEFASMLDYLENLVKK